MHKGGGRRGRSDQEASVCSQNLSRTMGICEKLGLDEATSGEQEQNPHANQGNSPSVIPSRPLSHGTGSLRGPAAAAVTMDAGYTPKSACLVVPLTSHLFFSHKVSGLIFRLPARFSSRLT